MDYFGYSSTEWYTSFEANGMDIFSNKDISDSQIITVLDRCCIGKECLIPTLKKASWSLERFIEAEKAFNLDEESLQLIVGEYVVLDKILNYSSKSSFDLRTQITSTYSISQLIEIGSKVLEHYEKEKN